MVTHKGYSVPYQLHCCAAQLLWPVLLDDWLDELLELDELLDDGTRDELLLEDELLTDDELELLEDAAPQILPLMAGCSAAPPFLFTWKPNSTRCPGGIWPFHDRLVAE